MFSMKKVFIIILICVLSACHSQEFSYQRSKLDLDNELLDVLDLMMAKGSYDDNQLVPYDKVSLIVDYSSQTVIVNAFQFSVYRNQRGGVYSFDSTDCYDNNGVLICKEVRGQVTDDALSEEVNLISSVDSLSSINVEEVVSEIINTYHPNQFENILLVLTLSKPEDTEDIISENENVLLFRDGEYHFIETHHHEGMMIEVAVLFSGKDSQEVFYVYFELDNT